jgi:hypothetical protein
MLILNPSTIFKVSWSIIQSFIDKVAAEKIQFLSKKDFPPLPQLIDPSMLQKKYGGTMPDLNSPFWPPKREIFQASNYY